MATAIQQQQQQHHHHPHHQPFSHGGLNGHGGGHKRYVALRPAEDDDSIATEQFPEFDPSHDGSEEESGSGDGDHYTHRPNGAAPGGGRGTVKAEVERGSSGNRPLFDDDGGDDDDDDDDEDNHHDHDRRLASVDPRPEPDHHDRGVRFMSPVTSPPYWAHNHTGGGAQSYSRLSGNYSTESLVPGAITLQDNEADGDDGDDGALQRASEATRTSYGRDRNKACWAKSVEVTDYVIVNGSATNIGAFVVWNIRVQTLSGPYMNIRKRYSEFDDFRHQLIQTFPNFEAAVPVLPPKSVISRFRPRFLEKRRAGLQYFLNCILLNPEFSGSPVLKNFLFS